MAYSEVYIDNDLSKLKTLLDTLVTNGIVGAVDKDDTGTYPVFKMYVDAEKTTEFFRLAQAQGQESTYTKYYMKATGSDGSYLDATNPVSAGNNCVQNYKIVYGYASEFGVYLTATMDTPNGAVRTAYGVIITKNQAGAPIAIFANNTNVGELYNPPPEDQIKTNLNTEYVVAPTDKSPLATLPRTAPTVRTQTVLSPFFSCPEAGHTSYTPHAGRILAGGLASLVTNARLTEITFDSGTWITNGYWALKVG